MTQSELTRPIIGLENRTPLEVFDMMCARIKAATPPHPSEPLVERVARAIWDTPQDQPEGLRPYTWKMNMSWDEARRCAENALAALPAPADDVDWRARCGHLLACLDSCDEAQGLPSELDPDDAALIRETRAALAKVKG